MAQEPVPGAGQDENPARDWRLVPSAETDWMDDDEWAAYQASSTGEEPDDPDLEQDPDHSPPPGLTGTQLAELITGAREIRTAGFGEGTPLDAAPGGTALMGFADAAAGADDRYPGCDDDGLVGAVCAWDRVEAHAAARKHAAVAELVRRRPVPGCAVEGEEQIPECWDEFVPDELALALAESRWYTEGLLDLACDLAARLPGTAAAFRSGTLRQRKVEIIVRATALLDEAESRAAEALVLGRAAKLTSGGLRAAIARAVMQVAPEKARKRREEAAKEARVERWAEDSGNAAIAGRELPSAEVLAADQRITWWAQQLKTAGLAGDMDELRARAYLDILLGMDSRPSPAPGGGQDNPDDGEDPGDSGPGGPGGGRWGPPGPGGPGAGPADRGPQFGGLPPGFVGRVNLTVPLATALGLAGRPGEIPGIGPLDPALARDLAAAAARNPRTSWCVTFTDQDGHAIGHGCARPEPRSASAKRDRTGALDGRDPPAGSGETGEQEFTFTPAGGPGPPGGYGTWRLSSGVAGQPDLLVALEPIAGECDHRHEAKGHDPGVLLRHLTQVRYASCTSPACRRPAARCDFEHGVPYEAGGRTCLCNGDPKCRHDHRLKQHPRWRADRLADGTIRWTAPSGRHYTAEPTRHPI
ncbi:MAG TPA: DUF222 domain-containing protein [Streptosporangiaceae bacterium]|nr:DUF222 domain-containing protein [Streptosporangiaceae bacterium]